MVTRPNMIEGEPDCGFRRDTRLERDFIGLSKRGNHEWRELL